MRLLRFRRNTIRLLKQLIFLWLLILIVLILQVVLLHIWTENNPPENRNASRVTILAEYTAKSLQDDVLQRYNHVASSQNILDIQNNSKKEKIFVVYPPVNETLPHSAQRHVMQERHSTESFFTTHSTKTGDPRSSYPPLYSVYSEGGQVRSGLSCSGRTFQLNGINIRILSGSINYFRVHPHYWKDRLRKLRTLGFNTVETYVPWNIHEQKAGQYNFILGWSNIRGFIQMAKQEDLLVILRPGPYICSQWDFGGLPSFLLRKEMIKYRSVDPDFLVPAKKYLKALSRAVVDLQWSQKYGAQPLIMIQLENEFNVTSDNLERDQKYILELKQAMQEEGMTEVQYTVTNKLAFIEREKIIPGVLQAVTVVAAAAHALTVLETEQPHAPMMVMEYWTGTYHRWFDANNQSATLNSVLIKNFVGIISSGASLNLYMFHGGSNFGFLGGGSHIKNETIPKPTTTSFDFGAPLSESGSYTKKYWLLRRVLTAVPSDPPYKVDYPPKATPAGDYPITAVTHYIPFEDLVMSLPMSVSQRNPRNMEALNTNQGNGQAYGFILYKKTSVKLNPGAVLKVAGIVRDVLYIIIDGKMITKPISVAEQLADHGYWMSRNPEFSLPGDGQLHELDLLVENVARFDSRDLNNQRKGIRGSVYINELLLTDWQVYPMEFKKLWLETNSLWQPFTPGDPVHAPALYKATLVIQPNDVHDTFINTMHEENQWSKGQVFINGFNLGRYWNVGPTKTLYLPGPLLRTGENEIIFYELFQPGKYVHFEEKAVLN